MPNVSDWNAALEVAAKSCEKRAACWATEGDAGATQGSIDINAELRNEATAIRELKLIESPV